MKKCLSQVLTFTAIILFSFASQALAQTPEVEKAEARVNQITDESGKYFKEGLYSLEDNRRPQAREKFDKSVEVFLSSTVDVRKNKQLQECYNQLIETVYRIEFPSIQQPQVRSLSATCGWNIDNKLADSTVKNSKASPNTTADNSTAAGNSVIGSGVSTTAIAATGFTEQKFEASPLDELAKLELTPEEKDVDNNPVAKQQYDYIQVAVANKSLGFSFQVHPMIQQFVNHFQGRGRQTMETGLYRSGMFMRMARRIFREEGVPENVAWLAQVESTWKPSALSSAAASGLWQFIPGTGSRFGLKRTAYVDERNGFEKATKAAAQYLKFLADRYQGNWELAMAAYNSGEGNVDRAISRAGQNSFWAAFPYLPQETRNYVPTILATILIANNPYQYGFGNIRPAPSLVYDQIRVPSSTNLGLLAQASDTSVEFLRYLNPELRGNITPPEPYIVRVPAGKANSVVAVLKKVPSNNRNTASVTTAMAGESLQNISARTGIPIDQLQAVNGSNARGKVVIPNGGIKRTAYVRPTTPTTTTNTSGVRVVKAVNGDTVAKLAQRYGASPVEVAKFNGLLPDSSLSAGREIKIPGR
jgi:membrane-bound lytic murein transglycosylase D